MTLPGLALRGSDAASRWLLLGSLALNLFLIGVGGALVMRSYDSDAPAAASARDRSIAGRVDRIAARLPQEDAERFRAAFQGQRETIERTRAAYYDQQDAVRSALRAQPFELDALRAALTEMRSARQVSDRQFHDFFAQQAAEMSSIGRQKLADWPSRRTVSQQPKN